MCEIGKGLISRIKPTSYSEFSQRCDLCVAGDVDIKLLPISKWDQEIKQ